MRTITKQLLGAGFTTLTLGCAGADGIPTESGAASASQSADRCENFLVETTAALGPVEVAPGVFTLGALPMPATIAGVSGLLGSAVTGLEASGAKGQGAQHITLVHTFVSPLGTFTTSDRATCAVAGKDANVCRVNDVLNVVGGTGVFANAGGSMRNHGVIDLNTYSLSVSLRGRVCGDGV
jgi:hypothetical protein